MTYHIQWLPAGTLGRGFSGPLEEVTPKVPLALRMLWEAFTLSGSATTLQVTLREPIPGNRVGILQPCSTFIFSVRKH